RLARPERSLARRRLVRLDQAPIRSSANRRRTKEKNPNETMPGIAGRDGRTRAGDGCGNRLRGRPTDPPYHDPGLEPRADAELEPDRERDERGRPERHLERGLGPGRPVERERAGLHRRHELLWRRRLWG